MGKSFVMSPFINILHLLLLVVIVILPSEYCDVTSFSGIDVQPPSNMTIVAIEKFIKYNQGKI